MRLLGIPRTAVFPRLHARTLSTPEQIRLLIAVCVVFLLFCIGVKLFGALITPVLGDLAESASLTAATLAITKSASTFLSENKVAYEELVTLTRDEIGRVTSLETNTVRLNTVLTGVTDAVAAYLAAHDDVSVSVPLGSLTGSPLLLGRGPRLRVRTTTAGGLSDKIENAFLSAGYNQSCHRLVLTLTLTYHMLLPNEVRPVTVSVPLCLSETVIVGEVPHIDTK